MIGSIMKGYRTLNVDEIRKRRNAKKATRLCILLIGESGTGKATFLDNLCGKKIFPTGNDVKASETSYHSLRKTKITVISEKVQLEDNAFSPVVLDIVLFPGCGDHINNSKTPEQIAGYLEAQFSSILSEEVRIKRNLGNRDNRPHVCLYFLTANSRGLRELDIRLMQELGKRTNLLPVISKADLLTEEELKNNKKLIMRDLSAHKINFFDFKDDTVEDNLMEIDHNSSIRKNTEFPSAMYIRDIMPFSIICSEDKTASGSGPTQHIRKHPGGNIIVEDPKNSDFIFLKGILLGSHLEVFKDYTNEVFYESYRTSALTEQQNCMDGIFMSAQKETMDRPVSISNSTRRNAFSVSGDFPKQSPAEVPLKCDGLEEKNNMIAAYRKKIELLEKRLKDGTDI
ncbi:hypothetical protein HG535_0F04740 [Zygotorulaspora mrakii]|uniref:Septin-type G domain-containing protein n=1 Tax=Zygotorulaspora mrakii TaxID=42260 RepID=A0A7H9B8A9_ZYGMR|nr:uncharacterized protein HG535_0F04740 [Zygotorulaspora mrakii]QLG73962.1 hypothetical protein HG535_0F04740 [Zygotorulaspora mrakii]